VDPRQGRTYGEARCCAHRISVAGGNSFTCLPTETHHVRVATTQLRLDVAAEVAAALAGAAQATDG